jgi:hypothetical protein
VSRLRDGVAKLKALPASMHRGRREQVDDHHSGHDQRDADEGGSDIAGSNYHASVTNLRHGGAQHETAARWFARRLIGVAPVRRGVS